MRWSALLLALLLGNVVAADEPPIRVRVKIAQAPATVNGKVILERHPNNRLLVVLLESESCSLRSDRQLDGEDAPRVFDMWWKDLPCGHYAVRAFIVRTDGEKHATDGFRIIGIHCEDPGMEGT